MGEGAGEGEGAGVGVSGPVVAGAGEGEGVGEDASVGVGESVVTGEGVATGVGVGAACEQAERTSSPNARKRKTVLLRLISHILPQSSVPVNLARFEMLPSRAISEQNTGGGWVGSP